VVSVRIAFIVCVLIEEQLDGLILIGIISQSEFAIIFFAILP